MNNKTISIMAVSAAVLLNGGIAASAETADSSMQAEASTDSGAAAEPEIITFDENKDKHEGTVYSYDECVAIIFSKTWGSKYDDGVTFPQQSLTYHKIRTFLDEYYLSDEGLYAEWDKYFDILNKWDWYLSSMSEPGLKTKDDGEGHYIVVDKETGEVVYTYELVDNMWKKLDKDGNVVDSFEPHPVGDKSEYDGILGNESVDAGESSSALDNDKPLEQSTDISSDIAVTGMVITTTLGQNEEIERVSEISVQSEDSSQSSDSSSAVEEESTDNKSTLKIIGAIIVAIVSAVGATISNKRKRKK